VNIDSIEASSSEGKGHFGVAVHTLLSENGNCTKLAFGFLQYMYKRLTSRLLDQALEAGHSR
jgi:hypothetical protein